MPASTQFPQVFGLGESWDPTVMKTVGATTGYEARVYNARGVSDTGRGIGVIMRGPQRRSRATTRAGAAPRNRSARIPTWSARWRRATSPGCTATIRVPAGGVHAQALRRELERDDAPARARRTSTRATCASTTPPRSGPPIREGHADGIMTAYNQINGIPAGVSPILKSMVRGEWGFDGFFSTDGQAATHWVHDQHYFHDAGRGHRRGDRPGGSGVLLQSNVAPTVERARSRRA